jgi:thioredoxin reductase (NADPH)
MLSRKFQIQTLKGDLYYVVGAGPAGLGAGLYTSRDRLKTLILEKFMPGGQISTTDKIENYPGIERIDGPGLIETMRKQVESFGAGIKTSSEVTGLHKRRDGIAVFCDADQFLARAVILAPGSSYRKLGIPGEEQFHSAGAGL